MLLGTHYIAASIIFQKGTSYETSGHGTPAIFHTNHPGLQIQEHSKSRFSMDIECMHVLTHASAVVCMKKMHTADADPHSFPLFPRSERKLSDIEKNLKPISSPKTSCQCVRLGHNDLHNDRPASKHMEISHQGTSTSLPPGGIDLSQDPRPRQALRTHPLSVRTERSPKASTLVQSAKHP